MDPDNLDERRFSTMDSYSPSQIAERVEVQGVTKATLPVFPTVMLGVVGGGFIALGAMFQTVFVSDPGWAAGPARLLGGIAFASGYLIAFSAGAQVFTSNNLVTMSWAAQRISTRALLKNWALIFLSNFLGVLGLALILLLAGHPEHFEGRVGTYTLEAGMAKAQEQFSTAFFRGVIGNLLVCIGVWLAIGGRTLTDKFVAPLIPIAAVSICGFEHGIGNLYYLVMALLIHVWTPGQDVTLPLDLWVLGSIRNLAAVTIGNILGGSGMVALVYHAVYRRPARPAFKGRSHS